VKVVVLCGGQGTRLREETEYRPKPLVEIGGRPILWHIMKIFGCYGLNEFVLSLGYRGNMIKEYFLNYEAMNNDFTISLGTRGDIAYHGAHHEGQFVVTCVDTGLETLTAGRVAGVASHLGDRFVVTYGDGVANIDIAALLDFHTSHGRLATVTTVRPTSRFGVLDIADDGAVRRFVEKPKLDGWASAGFFVFERSALDYLQSDAGMLEDGPLARLAADDQLMAYRHPGSFFAMDTYREYQMLNEMWASGTAPWKVWADPVRG
jgi:glucose-1-phosphate cytidylyltransferase